MEKGNEYLVRNNYRAKFHPLYFKCLDDIEEKMTESDFEEFFNLLNHEINVLMKNPYSNSRPCKFGILKELGFRTITFHSRKPRIGRGDMRLIFKVNDDKKITFYFAVGKRINLRPRPKNDIYSIVEDWLNDNEIESEEDLIIE